MEEQRPTGLTGVTIFLIIAIIIGLPVSAGLIVTLIAITNIPLVIGLIFLGIIDIGIVIGGYAAVKVSFRVKKSSA